MGAGPKPALWVGQRFAAILRRPPEARRYRVTVCLRQKAEINEATTLGFCLDDGAGYALAAGAFGGDPYANAIASYSFHQRAVLHFNFGVIHNRVPDTDRETWGLGIEVPLTGRWTAAAETFGQYGDTPTQHAGLRYALIPNRVQIDTTIGHQSGNPARRFTSLGLRLLF